MLSGKVRKDAHVMGDNLHAVAQFLGEQASVEKFLKVDKAPTVALYAIQQGWSDNEAALFLVRAAVLVVKWQPELEADVASLVERAVAKIKEP